MTSSMNNPEDLINAALVRVGYKRLIGSIWDGSEAAQVALAVYGQERDSLLRDGSWGFAQRNVTLTLLKSAPAGGYLPPTVWDPTLYPPLNFSYEYGYPDDCLKVRSLRPTPFFIPNFDPTPIEFSIDNDSAYTPARRVILSNLANAVCVYTGRVTAPDQWAVDFTQAFIEKLGEPLAAALTSPQLAQAEGAEGRADKTMAAMEQG